MSMTTLAQTANWLYNEFGIASLYHTGRDAWLIILARSCRMFAFGATSLILALFFSELDFADFEIGVFMTLTLVGDVLLSLGLTIVADGIGRRRVLLLGAIMMVISGAVFAIFENFWILLLAAVVGVISASGGDFGPFRAIEESIISHITTTKTRSDVLSWYVAASSLGSAIGTEFSGRLVEVFHGIPGWTLKDAYHGIFWLYIAMGFVSLLCSLAISDKTELAQTLPETQSTNEATETLLHHDGAHNNKTEGHDSPERNIKAEVTSGMKSGKRLSRFARISGRTQTVMYKLWFLLTVDSLADGMANYSLTNYYMARKFDLSKSTLGDIMSIAYFLFFPSTIFAGPLAKRIGLVNTMVFTHLPSSVAVLLFPVGRSLPLTILFLFIRTGLNNMDQAPRAAFIAAVVKPEERTAVMGITSTLRTLGSTLGPTLTGSLAENDKFWIAFVVAGALRIAYDLGLWAMYLNTEVAEDEVGVEEARHAMDAETAFELESLRSDSFESESPAR